MGRTPADSPSRRSKHLAAGLALILAALGQRRVAAAPNELGHPIVRDFPPGRSAIGHLCPAVTQDAAGFIYIASSAYARCYDGATWRLVELPTESAGIRKFATTAEGTIYMGGASVIGYFRGAGEAAEFVSLASQLPPTELGCDELFDVLAVGNTVYFADEEKILIWRDRRFIVIPCRTPPQSHGARLHRVGDTVYVTALDRALCRLVHDRLEVVADDPVLRQNQIISVEADAAGALVLLTAEQGFFQLTAGRVTPLPTQANRWLAGKSILRAQRLADGSLAVAFASVSGDGGMRFDANGRYVGPIDNSIGLYVKTLRDFFCDREGGLWLGTETGVFRIEWPSAVTVFDAVNGLGSGAVADVARHEGVLYAATGEGVYRLLASDDDNGRCARFERVFDHPAFDVVSHPGGLLVLGYTEIFVQSASGFIPVARLPAGGGSLYRSKRDPERVWIATSHGIQSIRRTPEGWHEEVAGTEASLAEVLADSSTAGSGDAGALDTRWRASATGIYRGSQPLPRLVTETAGVVARMWEETDRDGSVLWICGASGLVRLDVARAFPAPVPFATLLSTADARQGDQLAPDHTAIKFDYVALRHQIASAVTYQTRLVGLERDWSAWSPKRERTFTRLPPDRYRFEVRARDADGQLGAPAALAFVVLAPWWRTPWALLGYVVGGASVMGGVVWLRTRALHQRAARLEAIVAERTLELARQNTELVRLNQLELDEKISARLAEEKARLEMLRYQLNPHFLYNTLASISASLPAGRSTARAMVERLAEFCRLTLHRASADDWTTVGEEINLLRAYLEIEQSRWGDLLDVEIVCEPALAGERLPHFLLLPLVENALKYGRATSIDRVGLRLAARRGSDGALVLEVANTGEWVEPGGKTNVLSLGIGLDNLRERLARYYPRSHQLDITHAGGWVTVILSIQPAPAG